MLKLKTALALGLLFAQSHAVRLDSSQELVESHLKLPPFLAKTVQTEEEKAIEANKEIEEKKEFGKSVEKEEKKLKKLQKKLQATEKKVEEEKQKLELKLEEEQEKEKAKQRLETKLKLRNGINHRLEMRAIAQAQALAEVKARARISIMRAAKPNKAEEAAAAAVLMMMDYDGDGLVSEEDYKKFLGNFASDISNSELEILMADFRAMDKDHNGYVTGQEVVDFTKSQALSEIASVINELVEEIMGESDANKDNKLSFQEVLDAERKAKSPTKVNEAELRDEFTKADLDHDGFLSRDELEEVLWEEYEANPSAFSTVPSKPLL